MANQKFRVGVLGLQGSVIEHIQALHELGATPVEVKLSKHLEDLDGLIIPGGESTTMYKLAHAFDVFEALKTFVHSGRAVYGSCAGMIMLADHILDGIEGQETLGGLDVTVRRNAFGRQVDSAASHVNPGEFGGDTPLPAVFIRAPWVESVGSKVQVLATWQQTPESSPRAVAVRQGSLLATSFHPEVTSDRRVHRYFLDMVADYVQ
ncbi:pyridoxal 5'-phosphate synthase, glutaminase subunit Pdx2 [Mobiluncus mulieris 28-1]|nr:pyridoxal 5'-phosphate synthase glutaminase subunit PdxT [Mobiluncus mulieris]EEZ91156.1 pyridoxal 5'-phosphate synthase, glutaminase subunit Pdx2 [Mobiluncus mulieris 28-1]EFN93002.1 pyridoxal 5'-phosphate synthase, glutaminase subunit Pdx2 [Mobiluncus mulieris FB024-16]MBB5846064.1 5'-phosphate synthase pdxT subunit [Mobiluncus mulieris]SPX75874.1 Glutamine amidotransferase subunit pdxT [Mobiluncus mulieris]STO17451.1 Glutamine amidotransferase subunit pdxT [Mobiluncus mulieris]